MAMTLRLNGEDDAAVTAIALREGTSKHDVIVRAVRRYASERSDALEVAITRVEMRDAALLDRLAQA